MTLDPVAKIFIGLGTALLLIGIAWQFGLIQTLRLGRLPGDIAIEKENFRLYLPITTCVLVSIALTFISWLLKRF